MERRFAEYWPAQPWSWRRLRNRVRLFRSVRLNLIGWGAVAALCLAGAAVGYAGGRLVDLKAGLGLGGGCAAVLTTLLVLDRRRSARLHDRNASEH
jgi:hypothetical protein